MLASKYAPYYKQQQHLVQQRTEPKPPHYNNTQSASPNQVIDYSTYLVDVSVTLLQTATNSSENARTLVDKIRCLYKTSRVSYSILLVALIYLLRYIQMRQPHQQPIILQFTKGHRLMAVCVMLACKFVQDRNASNESWAGLAGCSLEEFNAEEETLLRCIEYRMWITKAVFERWTEFLFRRDLLQSYCKSPYQGFDPLPTSHQLPPGSFPSRKRPIK